jgi:protein-S-isoprenylcysteine O-methyltransferase Ste14
VQHKRVPKHRKKAAHRKATVVSTHSAPEPPQLTASPRVALGGAPVETTSGGSSPTGWIVGFGVLLALLGAGLAYAPRAALPRGTAFRLEPHRQTILVTGAAIGIGCILVGILTSLVGR